MPFVNICKIPDSFFFLLLLSEVKPTCIFNSMEYYDGDMFRMDACRFCRCQGGVSICFSAQCGELHCDRYYVPEGECCPVCEGMVSFESLFCILLFYFVLLLKMSEEVFHVVVLKFVSSFLIWFFFYISCYDLRHSHVFCIFWAPSSQMLYEAVPNFCTRDYSFS